MVQLGSFWTLPELNWRYLIRRRVGGNVDVYLGMSYCVLSILRCAYEVGRRP